MNNVSAPTISPRIIEQISELSDPGWKVTVFNNETNTYQEVILILVAATGCDVEEAYVETWEIDRHGQCIVHRGSQEECEKARDIIATIGIHVEAAIDDGE